MLTLVNGQATDAISASDRGLQYADGLFETLAVARGKPRFLEWHYQRLVLGATRLQLPVPPLAQLREEFERVIHAGATVIKLVLSRGPAGRGYRMPKAALPTRIVAGFAAPTWPQQHWQHGVRLRHCSLQLGRNPLLAGIKHLNRLEQVLARSEWQDESIAEGLLCDDSGALVGGTQTNVFLYQARRLVTPALFECGVAGIMRRALCEWVTMQGIAVEERRVMPDELCAAEEVLLTNSLIGAWPARELAGRSVTQAGLAARFNAWLAQQ